MLRTLIVSLIVLVAACCFGVRSADAKLSRNNPYRSFNISGYNYASTHWEKSHGMQSGKNWSNHRRTFRRW